MAYAVRSILVEWFDGMAEERILIIDDSTELRSLLESILPFSGYKTLSASTGEEGLALATSVRPDVILVDLELPDTTGLKVIEELNQRGIEIPTIMITGYGSEGTAARALRLGAQGYLVKPFTTEEVLSNVEKALIVRRLNRESALLEAQLDARERHLRALAAIGRALTEEIGIELFYQRIVDAGAFVTRAERCALALLDPISAQLEIVATRGKTDPRAMTASPQKGAPELGAVLEEAASVRLQAAEGETILLRTGDEVKAVLQVPLRMQGQTLGLLSVDRQDSRLAFDRHDELMLTILADYVMIALKVHQPKTAAADSHSAAEAPSADPNS
jgi:DNA-binding response OmpR family regulator